MAVSFRVRVTAVERAVQVYLEVQGFDQCLYRIFSASSAVLLSKRVRAFLHGLWRHKETCLCTGSQC